MKEREAATKVNILLDQLLNHHPTTRKELLRIFKKIRRLIKSITLHRNEYYIIWKMDARFRVLYRIYLRPHRIIVVNSAIGMNPGEDTYFHFVCRIRQYISYVLQNPSSIN